MPQNNAADEQGKSGLQIKKKKKNWRPHLSN